MRPESSYKGLANKVFPGVLSMAKGHAKIFFATLPFAVVGLNGPILGRHQDHNGFVFLGGALLSPFVAALIIILFPFKPYQGSPFARGSHLVDANDPEMARLVSIFQSSQLSTFLWRSTSQLTVILLVLMAFLLIVDRNTLEWSWHLPDAGIGLTLIACWIALGSAVMNWGFRTYSDTLGDLEPTLSVKPL
jgi:hypothetical protein